MAVGLYLVFAIVWGTRALGAVLGDGVALQVALLTVHVSAGFAIGRWWAPALAVAPISVAIVTGSDLVETWGYLVFAGVGAGVLLVGGVCLRMATDWLIMQRDATNRRRRQRHAPLA